MKPSPSNPRILIVTPEVTYLPDGMGNIAHFLTAKAGGLADVSSALINALFDQGADVHVALPDYREIFSSLLPPILRKETQKIRSRMPQDRIHLAQDRVFFYMSHVYSNYDWENIKISLAFQREVINNIVPLVKPDLIHCNDWMTGLIPGMARELGIPCLFTVHNIHTMKVFLAQIEDMGIDGASFWQHLYYERMAYDYITTRESNPVDLLCSGIFAAHFVNTVSPTFLAEVVEGRHGFIEPQLQREILNKWHAECAVGILNAPDPSHDPAKDEALIRCYTPEDHTAGKVENKCFLQETLGLVRDPQAPLFFWPSRLDSVQKGCQLLAEILSPVVSKYWEKNFQVVFVANGEFQRHFRDIVRFHRISSRVSVCDFDEHLSRLAYGASDFILMPSRFEPCGLPQMIAPIYGSLPVAHDTGGIHDTVSHLDVAGGTGNGFLFKHMDTAALLWAIDQAMNFYALPTETRAAEIRRIMKQSAREFNHSVTARRYIDLYEKMLKRPLINIQPPQ